MGLFKPLLTKDERRSLSAEDRRALKKERRSERKAERDIDPSRVLSEIVGFLDRLVDLVSLEKAIREAILDVASEAIPGEEKLWLVLEELAERADDWLTWDWAGPAGLALEAVDGPLLRGVLTTLLRPHVQRIYDALKEQGLVDLAEEIE